MIRDLLKRTQAAAGKKTELQDGKALKQHNKAIRKDPENAGLYFERGNYSLKNKSYVKAIIDYNRAIRLNCRFIEAYHSRAVAKEKMSYYQGAVADYNYILSCDPADTMASENKKIILSKLK